MERRGIAGFRQLEFVIPIVGSVLTLLPEARAGCSNAARPDPWRGLWVTMIRTPTGGRGYDKIPLLDGTGPVSRNSYRPGDRAIAVGKASRYLQRDRRIAV